MSDWKHKRIEDIAFFNPPCSLKIGNPAKKIPMSYLKEFQRKIIGYEISEYVSGPKFINGDTLVAKITPCLENGKTAFVDILEDGEIAFGSSEFIVLRAKEGNDKLFLYYLSISPTFREKAVSCMEGTSGRKRVNETSLKNQELPIPDFATQQRISSVLSSLDAKIELNNKINRELEAVAKTLYDYWFVQFNFPDKNGKPYKSSGGKMVWNEQLKREIPEGWEAGILSDIANITMGQSPSGESYNESKEGMFFFQGCTDFGERFPSIRQYTTAPTRFAKPSDILLSVRAPVGTLNIANVDCCIGRGLAALNSKHNCISYLYEVMKSFKQIFDRRNVDGTTFGSITKDDLFSLKIIKPEKNIVEKYEKIMNSFFQKLNDVEKENQQLSSLRDWLLPMLMNGQVTVQEAEERISMVAEQEVGYGK